MTTYQHHNRNERDDADDERLVAVEVGVDEIVAEPRQREDALDDDRADRADDREISALDLASAYATFAADGVSVWAAGVA